MKRFLLIITSFVLSLTFLIPTISKSNAKAVSFMQKNTFTSSINQTINALKNISSRIAGTDGENESATYIHDKLSEIVGFEPTNEGTIQNGYQSFKFKSNYLNGYADSRNVIFEKSARIETEKKVILACNYDSLTVVYNDESKTYETVDCEAVNASAGSVALLIELARVIATENFDFDVEVIFFGAGENNCDGARYYLSGLNATERENIICFIDFNRVSVGKNCYFYVDEIETNLSKYVDEISYSKEIEVSKINTNFLTKELTKDDEKSLSYSHIALKSENTLFINNGINSIEFISGDYEQGLIGGNQEFLGTQSIVGTENDNRQYVADKYGESHIVDNLYRYYRLTLEIINDDGFVAASNSSSTKLFHKIFSNEMIVVYLTGVMFLISVIVVISIHYKLTIKSYYVNVEDEFLKSVLKISDEIDATGNNYELPKVVSQVIAKDIKKNKTIKQKKNKKDS